MFVRGIRGAITVENNEKTEILDATFELLNEMIEKNNVHPEDTSWVLITVTHDLNATFPAQAIRKLQGWELVPLMCSLEIDVPGGLPQCIRLLMQVNTDKRQDEIVHVYLNEAKRLRPDLTS